MASCRELLRAFPQTARDVAGHQLYLVQKGGEPDDWKPMNDIGSGVRENRVHAVTQYRVIYVAKFEEAIYVLHLFEKRSRKTAKKDIALARRRHAEAIALHAAHRRT